jgi:hypothetical protein
VAINFTRLFTRLGANVYGLNLINTYRATTLPTRWGVIDALYATVNPELTDGLYPALMSAQASAQDAATYLSTLSQNVLIAEVKNDRPLTAPTVQAALVELDRQMRAGSQSLNAYPGTVGVTPTLTDGSALVTATVLNPRGLASDLLLPDSLILTPTGFGYTASMQMVGTAAVGKLAYNWPQGSGINQPISVTDVDAQPTMLTNGRLLNLFTSPPTPDGWTTSAGPTYTNPTDDPKGTGGLTCLQVVTVAGAAKISQQIPVQLSPLTTYAWTLKYKRTAGTTFNIVVSLTNSTGTILTSDAAVNQTTSVAQAGAAPSTWATIGGYFTTPANVPSNARFEFGMDSSTATVRFAHAGLALANPLTPSGPTINAWAGTLPQSTRDYYTVAVSLAGSSSSSLLRGVNRFLNIDSLLPTGLPTDNAGGETISDSLIA